MQLEPGTDPLVSAALLPRPHVNSTAESFVSAYYSAWDNDRSTLKTLYMPTSRIVWNGNPISGGGEMAQFIDKMPASKHDVRKRAGLHRQLASATFRELS